MREPVKSLARALYDEEIRYVDDRIGRFLDELRALGLYDEALIAFVSDHGETLWSHYDAYGTSASANTPSSPGCRSSSSRPPEAGTGGVRSTRPAMPPPRPWSTWRPATRSTGSSSS